MDFSLTPEIERLISNVIYPNGWEFDRDFDDWLRANPHIYFALLARALHLWHHGRDHYGIGALFEEARWHTGLSDRLDPKFKLCNDWRADIARLILFSYPPLREMFTTKKRTSLNLGCFGGTAPYRILRQQSLDLH